MIAIAVDRGRKAQHRYARATRRGRSCSLFRFAAETVELAASSSVATRPGAASAVPEVTINGRSEPASAAPSVSIASLSVSAAAA